MVRTGTRISAVHAGMSHRRAILYLRGAIAALSPIAGSRSKGFAEGPWCWLLANVRPIEPMPYRGRQKLFDVPWPG